ncbi:BRO family protein [Kitasatospora sp. NPDC049258]|uniref:BRO-N domain-containing protein n=1 Tax=Kitasatospora sp. NPDC049258 TaxID=3155394 RepID=UPI00344AD101
MDDQADMELVRTSFPGTGQPIRVVMIDGEPWFATVDVCKVLGLTNPTQASKLAGPGRSRTVNSHSITINRIEGNDEVAGQKPYGRGNPTLNLVSEAGLYALVMRSDKPAARTFQDWVVGELLPSIRRGDTDLPRQRKRMAESLAGAVGQRVEVVAEIDHHGTTGIHVRSDGTVHCRHGEMDFRMPSREEDSGPPFGPYYECRSIERVGIRGGRALARCARLKLVDLARHLRHAPGPHDAPHRDPHGAPQTPAPTAAAAGPLVCELGAARVHGGPAAIADLLRAAGQL